MTSVVTRAAVIVEFGAEYGRDGFVLNEVRVLAVGVVDRKRSRRYVLGHPGGIASAAVENRGGGESGVEVVDWTREPILKKAVGVDGRRYVLQWTWIRGYWRCGRGGGLRI